MKIAIISVTVRGCALSEKISGFLADEHEVSCFSFHKSCGGNSNSFLDLNTLISEAFGKYGALVFVCACGIAVRSVAPFLRSKATDPAVVVIDDSGKFVISLLSGHLGGANALAEKIAHKINAVPVVTTATDVGGKFSPDSFAAANNLIITDLSVAKEIAAAVLKDEKIGFLSDCECKNIPCEIETCGCFRTGVCISAETSKKPFEITLNLVPKNIVVGIGCKKGTACAYIEKRVCECLSAVGIDVKRICAVVTIDIKSGEKGLNEYCEKNSLELITYSAAELMSVKGDFAKSAFVMSKTGTDNVCERSVVKYGAKLILRKQAGCGITVSAGEKPIEIDFGRTLL